MHWNVYTADAQSFLHFSALLGCHPGGRVIGVTWGGGGGGANKNCECLLNECFCGVKTEKKERPVRSN